MKKLFLLLILLPVYFQGCVILEETARHIKTPVAWGGNYGSSVEGKDANVTFVHTSAIDSAHFVFGYPDTTNWYDSVFTYPIAWGSGKIMNGAGLDLDSVGVHVVKVRYYSGGAVAGHSAGVWLHESDSVYSAIADANKANFKADVSGLSTHSAADVWTAGSRSLSTPADYKANVTNLDVAVSTRFTQAGGDSVKNIVEAIALYWGAKADGYYQILFPRDGTVSKDSVGIFDDGDIHKATIYFHHSNVEAVVDSITFRKW